MQIKLGFCKPPEPTYLYVRSDESGDSLWYKYDIERNQSIPVCDRGLCGYVTEIRLTEKEFKGKTNLKLDIVVTTDEDTFIVRSGIETQFSKTFLLAFAELATKYPGEILSHTRPIIIAVQPGQENVVFCRIYDGSMRVKAEWNPNTDWVALAQWIQSALGQGQNVRPSQARSQLQTQTNWLEPEPNPDLLRGEIHSLLQRKKVRADQLTVLLQKAGLTTLESADAFQLRQFRDRLQNCN